MQFNATATKTFAVGAALALALAGCGANSSSQSSSSASSSSASSSSAVQQKEATVNWTTAGSADEAAKGAGLDKFGVIESLTLDGKEFKNPQFSYAGGVAQATYETDGVKFILRKGANGHSAPIADRDLTSFKNKETASIDGTDVTEYGAAHGASTVLTWNENSSDYGVTYEAANNGDASMDAKEVDEIVRAIKGANANAQQQSASSSSQQQGSSSQQQSSQQQSNNNQQQSNNGGGTNASYGSEQATQIALSYFGAGGAAKGPANNVSVNGPIEGGGTTYYTVSFDLGAAHCQCNVDATDGHVYAASETTDGVETNLDENGNPDLVYDHNTGEQLS